MNNQMNLRRGVVAVCLLGLILMGWHFRSQKRIDLAALVDHPVRLHQNPAPSSIFNKQASLQQKAAQAQQKVMAGGRDPEAARRRVAADLSSNLGRVIKSKSTSLQPPLLGPGRGYGQNVLNPEQQRAIQALLSQLGPDTELQLDASDGTLRFLQGDLKDLVAGDLDYLVASSQGNYGDMALATLGALARVLNVVQPAQEFVALRPDHDELGMTHVKLDQYHQGLPVYGAQAMVHFDADGSPIRINGVYAPTPAMEIPVAWTISEAQAIDEAWKALGKSDPGLRPPQIERIYYWNPNVSPILSYQVDLVSSPVEFWHIFVSAEDGRVIHKSQGSRSASVSGQAQDLLKATRTVTSWQDGGTYLAIDTSMSMYDAARSRPPSYTNLFGAICIFDVQQQNVEDALQQGVSYVQSSNANQWDPTAVSVMESFKRTFQYFKTTHNRNSYDDKGINITGLIHAKFKNPSGQLYNDNAFFNPGMNIMVFGDGSQAVNPGMLPAAVDITAHELSHGVVDNSAAFVYENQSGALHEHMADFFACMVDREDWIMGEDALIGTQHQGWRDLSNPGNAQMSDPGPKNMAEYKNLPNTAQGDNGGVHVNSTIPSHATYLISDGPQGLGREKTEKIIYRALTKYMTKNNGFIDYRRAAISAARDLYPNSNEASVVAQAFDSIQLLEAETKPPPTPVPATSGEELVLFLRMEVDPFWGMPMGHGLYVMSSQGYQIVASEYNAMVRPAVSGDGEWALYVSEDNDVYITDGTQDEQLTFTGEVRTIAMTKDQHYIAFTTVDYDNTIGIIDLTTEEVRTATLKIPTSGEEVELSYADVLTFNCVGDTLYFDAWSEGKMGQTQYGCWGLYSMRLKDLICRAALPLSPGLQVGNPSLANTLPNLLVADYIYTTNQQETIGSIALDLNQNTMSVLLKGLNTFAAATFRGDDTKIVYQTFEGQMYYLKEAALNPDHSAIVPGSEKALLWSISSLAYPVGFRSGAYTPPSGKLEMTPATLNFGTIPVGQAVTNDIALRNTGSADLDLIEVSLENGEINSYDFASAMEKRIPAGQSQVVKIKFHPEKAGSLAVALRAKTTAPGQPDVVAQLTGTGQSINTTNYWRQVWQDFQDNYSYFDYKNINWPAIYNQQVLNFENVTPDQFAERLNNALQVLHDWHVTVKKTDGTYLGYNGQWERNYSTKFYNSYTGGSGYINLNNANVLWHASVSNNIAYLVVDTFSSDRFSKISDADIEQVFATYANAAGMIIDFRSNSGGAEDNAIKLAARLIEQPVPYGYVRFRKAQTVPYDFNDYVTKTLQPSSGKRFLKPVVGLMGQRCMSSAEWFTLMLKNAPNTILIGDRSRGASGNPITKGIPALNIEYDISQWMAYTEEKVPFEDKGIQPAVLLPVQASFDDNLQRDYVLEKAIAYLRWREALGQRLPLVSARSDLDQDGIKDVDEFVAGSDPLTASASPVFAFKKPGIRKNAGGGFVLMWESQAGQSFAVWCSENVTGGYVLIAPNVSATPPLNEFQVTPGANRYFYRLQRK